MTNELTVALRPSGDLGDQVRFRTGRYLTAAEQAALLALLVAEPETCPLSKQDLAAKLKLTDADTASLEQLDVLHREDMPQTHYTRESVQAYMAARLAAISLLELEAKFDLSDCSDSDALSCYVNVAMAYVQACSEQIYDTVKCDAYRVVTSAQADAPVTATVSLARTVLALIDKFRLVPSLTLQQQSQLDDYVEWVL